MADGGNVKARDQYEAAVPPCWKRPTQDDALLVVKICPVLHHFPILVYEREEERERGRERERELCTCVCDIEHARES